MSRRVSHGGAFKRHVLVRGALQSFNKRTRRPRYSGGVPPNVNAHTQSARDGGCEAPLANHSGERLRRHACVSLGGAYSASGVASKRLLPPMSLYVFVERV